MHTRFNRPNSWLLWFIWGADPIVSSADAFIISVPGILGRYCTYGVEKRLLVMPDVKRVELDWAQQQIRVMTTNASAVTTQDIEQAVERADYPAGITTDDSGAICVSDFFNQRIWKLNCSNQTKLSQPAEVIQ